MVKEEHIVFLTITSWVDVSAGAKHYYGRLRPLNGSQQHDVKFILSKEEALALSIERGMSVDCGYVEGDESERFKSKKAVIATARKQFKIAFPKAKVLVLGDRGVVEPQEILVGPPEFKREINALVKAYDKLDWDYSKEDQLEIKQLEEKWEKWWPSKYT
jgi:hypothetical protein